MTCLNISRAGDMYSSYYEIYVSQHDVLRDLALHLSNQANVNDRRRLLMPKRDADLPKEWARNVDRPFKAQIVSVHTGIWLQLLNQDYIFTVLFEFNHTTKKIHDYHINWYFKISLFLDCNITLLFKSLSH